MAELTVEQRSRLRDDLAATIAGDVLGAGDDGYDASRAVWNSRFDRHPAVIARCTSPEDVSAAVSFARNRELPLSVKGGGHDYAGNTVAEGSLLIDLGPMASVDVDPGARRARVGAGATWGAFDAAAQAHGLATTGASVSTVGVAGFTLGGGEGWLARKHGLAVDNLLAVDVVTASGELVRASGAEHPELFWAIRGGGGNFGVVTSFEYRLHEVGPQVLAGQVLYPLERAPELLRFYRDYFETAPDEVGCYPFFLRIPPIPDFPAELHGRIVLDFVVCYAGDLVEGERHLAPFRERGDTLVDTIGPIPYTTLQTSFDAGMTKGNRWYSRGQYIEELSDELIDSLLDHLEPFPGELTIVYLGAQGGAIARTDSDELAFPHRGASHALHALAGWVDEARDEEIMAWARELHDAVRESTNGRVYVNLLGDDEESRIRDAYGNNYERLSALKRVWDPQNLFHTNHNIQPGD